MGEPKVPDTIGKGKGDVLRNAGAKRDWFSKKAVQQRKASNAQRDKKHLS